MFHENKDDILELMGRDMTLTIFRGLDGIYRLKNKLGLPDKGTNGAVVVEFLASDMVYDLLCQMGKRHRGN